MINLGQALFLLATLACAAAAYFLYRKFATPARTSVFDELRASGVEREKHDFPWKDWKFEARDAYRSRMAAAQAAAPGGEMPLPLGEEEKLELPEDGFAAATASDGSFCAGERHVMLVKRMMTLIRYIPVFQAHQPKVVKLQEQGFLDEDEWQLFLDTVKSLNEEDKALSDDIAALKSGEKYKQGLAQQAHLYLSYLNRPSPRLPLFVWSWEERDAYLQKRAENVDDLKILGPLMIDRVASLLWRSMEFQHQIKIVMELRVHAVLPEEDWEAFNRAAKMVETENKETEAEVGRLNPSPEFKQFIMQGAQRKCALKQQQLQQQQQQQQQQRAAEEKRRADADANSDDKGKGGASPAADAKSPTAGKASKSVASPTAGAAKSTTESMSPAAVAEAERQRLVNELLESEEKEKKKAELRKRANAKPASPAAAAAALVASPAGSGSGKLKSPIIVGGSSKVEPVGKMKVVADDDSDE